MAIEQIQHFLDNIILMMDDCGKQIKKRKEYDETWRQRLQEL